MEPKIRWQEINFKQAVTEEVKHRNYKNLQLKVMTDSSEEKKELDENRNKSADPSSQSEEEEEKETHYTSDTSDLSLGNSFVPLRNEQYNPQILVSKPESIAHLTEDFQDEQKAFPLQSDDTDSGCENPTAETSSPCKATGSPACSNKERIEGDGSRVYPSCTEINQSESDPPVMAEQVSATNTLPLNSHLHFSTTDFCCLTHSHSMPSLNKIPKNNLIRRASLPDMRSQEFTPDISADDLDDETYRFQCSFPGFYQCSVTNLMFNMKGEGDVVYRTVPWNRRLLAQNDKKPAGPLFDIKCQQQSVCQLHLPHCEILSTGGGQFLQVAHVKDESIEFITPHKITETHVVVNITGLSCYGMIRNEDFPPGPVRALVLLFYRPPNDPDLTSFLNVLLLPKNVALQNVLHTRKTLSGTEMYIETSPHCKLHPRHVYTLLTAPEDDSILVQPAEAEFDEESYDNYFPSFQVILKKNMSDIKLFLRDSSSTHRVWERQVYLSSSGVKKSCGSTPLNVLSTDKLLNVRSCFIDAISGPVLNCLVDKLLDKKVMTDAEREAADVMKNRRDNARFVIDTVRKKGEAASSEMIEFLSELDSFLCKHLGLI